MMAEQQLWDAASPRAEAEPEPPVLPRDLDLWDQGLRVARERVIADFERHYLTWLMSRAGGNMSRAARIARVDRTTLYRLIDKHGLRQATIMRSSA